MTIPGWKLIQLLFTLGVEARDIGRRRKDQQSERHRILYSCVTADRQPHRWVRSIGLERIPPQCIFIYRPLPWNRVWIVRSLFRSYETFNHTRLFVFTKVVYITRSPGFGLALVAESTTGTLLSVEQVAEPGTIKWWLQHLNSEDDLLVIVSSIGELPEDLGKMTAYMLLEEIYNRGVIDTTNQSFMLLYMVLCLEDVSKIRLGKISPHTLVVSPFFCSFQQVIIRKHHFTISSSIPIQYHWSL